MSPIRSKLCPLPSPSCYSIRFVSFFFLPFFTLSCHCCRTSPSSTSSSPSSSSSLSSGPQIYPADSYYEQTTDGLFVSRVNLRLHLQSAHFSGHGLLATHYVHGGHGGHDDAANMIQHGGGATGSSSSGTVYTQQHVASGLRLRCTAQIPELYEEHTELELGVPPRDPVPARGKIW